MTGTCFDLFQQTFLEKEGGIRTDLSATVNGGSREKLGWILLPLLFYFILLKKFHNKKLYFLSPSVLRRTFLGSFGTFNIICHALVKSRISRGSKKPGPARGLVRLRLESGTAAQALSTHSAGSWVGSRGTPCQPLAFGQRMWRPWGDGHHRVWGPGRSTCHSSSFILLCGKLS